MNLKIVSSRDDVDIFLRELKEILVNPNFDVLRDLDILLKKRSEAATDPYSTENTLLALDFDKNDVIHQLMALELSEYLETFIDKDNYVLNPTLCVGDPKRKYRCR